MSPTPLVSPDALYALLHYVQDPHVVDTLVREYSTWENLASRDDAELVWKLGTSASHLHLPPSPPPMPSPGPDVAVVSRYTHTYPARLRDLDAPPVLLYLRGSLPSTPYVGIGGSHYPSAAGVEAARSAAAISVKLGLPVVAALDAGCGTAALQEAVAKKGKAVAVSSTPLDAPGNSAGLIESILLLGGAVLSEYGPHEQWSDAHLFSSSALVAALSSCVVLPELGVHPTGGSAFARAAIRLSRFLIVPAPAPDAILQVTATGAASLARPRNFSPSYFGSSPRLRARVAAGKPPADAVVTSPKELRSAIVYSCNLPAAS